jgi:hypothetical protein
VHGDQLVVELGKHDAARGIQLTEPASDDRYWLTGIGELPPEDNGEREANQEKAEAGQRVLQADDFVIQREDVFSEQNRSDSIESRHGRKVLGRPVSYDACRRGARAERAGAYSLHAEFPGATNSLR